MVNYGNGKIYKVICSETGRVYVGSTTVTLSRRMTNHRCKKNNNCMTKDFIEPKIFLIEDYPCDRKEQLLSRERYFMESIECVNLIRPIVTKEETLQSIKEWTQDNKEHIKEYKKNYQQENKEIIKTTKKEYYENNKETILKKNNEYRQNNKDQLNQKAKDYREKNKEKINKRRSEKFTCECGGKFTLKNKSQHFKSKKHIKFLHSLQTSQPSDASTSPIPFVP